MHVAYAGLWYGAAQGSVGWILVTPAGMTDFEDRVRRMSMEAMKEIGRDRGEIADVIEPPGADYCVITFANPDVKPIEIPKPLGAGESQELDDPESAAVPVRNVKRGPRAEG